jgi:glucuronokinase
LTSRAPDPLALAEIALAVEREDLGIAGGRQDQIAESYGGLTLMDFATDRHEPLDPTLLPPLVVAWRTDYAENSGIAHAKLRARHRAGEAAVVRHLAKLRSLALAAREALVAGDRQRFAECVDGSFDLRARIMPLDPRHVGMIERARAAGAAANYCGSGGAIVAVCDSEAHRAGVLDALAGAGCSVLAVGRRA